MEQMPARAFMAAVIVLVDLLVFVVPLTGLLVAYIVLVRPPWFWRWIEALYERR